MPTKQFHELNATASIIPDVKKQVMITEPIQAISSSWLVYLVTVLTCRLFSIASISSCFGDGVGLLEESFILHELLTGLGLLETFGVLFSVGAAELNFWRSMFEVVLSNTGFSVSRNLTAMLTGIEGVDIV